MILTIKNHGTCFKRISSFLQSEHLSHDISLDNWYGNRKYKIERSDNKSRENKTGQEKLEQHSVIKDGSELLLL